MYAPALFLVPYGSRAGYAIDTYSRMFLRAAAQLNDGDETRVHFTFRSVRDGLPKHFPPNFTNYLEFDQESPNPERTAALAAYVRKHDVRMVMLLDVQPVSPIVAMVRDMGVRTVIGYWGAPVSDSFSGPRLWLKRLGVRLAGSRRADALIFESHAMADLAITGRGCPRSMLDVVYLGTDVRQFKPPQRKGYLHSEYGLSPERKVVLFSGHVNERKGLATLMDAAVELVHNRRRSDLFFLICGNRGDDAERWLSRVRGTLAADCVRFAGYRQDMPAVMANADIGVIPSLGWESFTVSSIEMAASGLPVIVSRLGGLPEAVLDGETGLVFEPGNVSALANCIEKLADNAELRNRLGAQGRSRAEREFSREEQYTKLCQVFARRVNQS